MVFPGLVLFTAVISVVLVVLVFYQLILRSRASTHHRSWVPVAIPVVLLLATVVAFVLETLLLLSPTPTA
jgi:hypothetical protein